MKKEAENTRQTGAPTTTKEAESRVNTNVLSFGKLTVSETAQGTMKSMDRNTPSNELILRGFC